MGWILVGAGLVGVGVYVAAFALFAKQRYLLPGEERSRADWEEIGWRGAYRRISRAERVGGVIGGVLLVGVGILWLLSGA